MPRYEAAHINAVSGTCFPACAVCGSGRDHHDALHAAVPEAMLALQESIREHGYTVSRVQRIDVGLTGMGYKTDKYRIVFAGKIDEIREMTRRSPQLAAYLPPKISIFAESGHTVLVSMNPEIFAEIAGDAIDPVIFDRWSSDLRSIFHDVNTAN